MVFDIPQQSDQHLIEQFRNGCQSAAETLICRYKDNVYTTIYYLVKDKYIAEDLFQDTFLKVLGQLKRNNYIEQGKFLPWLLRIAHNLCIDYFRKAKKKVRITFQDGTDLLDCLVSHTDSYEKQIVKTEVENSVQKMVEQLPMTQREVVVMRIYGELSFKEIAAMTGVSINTALGRMRYALKNLRKIVEDKNLVLR